ncbi:unnamed protein product, partial [Meganyctiphanes norvegica]
IQKKKTKRRKTNNKKEKHWNTNKLTQPDEKKLRKQDFKKKNQKMSKNVKKCASVQFQCSNGECISKNLRCNGHIDCPNDMADELMCSKCQRNAFNCGGGECIPLKWECDGEEDCNNGRDELDCRSHGSAATPKSRCGPAGWECFLKDRCISKGKRCDGDMDCDDGSDEVNCQ